MALDVLDIIDAEHEKKTEDILDLSGVDETVVHQSFNQVIKQSHELGLSHHNSVADVTQTNFHFWKLFKCV